MKRTWTLVVCVAVVAGLLLLDICLRVRQLGDTAEGFALTKQFAVVPLYTNGVKGVLIADRVKHQPLWGKWYFAAGDSVDFFIEGKSVVTVASVKEGRSETVVRFYGQDGKLVSEWKGRENGGFYMRTLFGEGSPRSEAWLNDSWHTIEMRTNQGRAEPGTILEGKWRRLIATNGVPGVEN